MASVNLPAGIPAYVPADPAAATSNAIGSDPQALQDNFMKMLLAQLQNQNPLDPTDANQFTSQLTQLSMLRGIDRLNTSFQSYLEQMQSASLFAQSDIVGRNLLASGDSFEFGGPPVAGVVRLGQDAASLIASVRDSNGLLVDQMELGPARAGDFPFSWDGTNSKGDAVPAGRYRVSVAAKDATGGNVSTSTFIEGAAVGLRREGTATVVDLADGRSVRSSDILGLVK